MFYRLNVGLELMSLRSRVVYSSDRAGQVTKDKDHFRRHVLIVGHRFALLCIYFKVSKPLPQYFFFHSPSINTECDLLTVLALSLGWII